MTCFISFLDSHFRGNDRFLVYFVIPAKAGMHGQIPRLIDLLLNRQLNMSFRPKRSGEPPLAAQVFGEDVLIDGPAGTYRFVVASEQDAAAAGGEAVFNVLDEMPSVGAEVVLWGEDAELADWLVEHGLDPEAIRLL